MVKRKITEYTVAVGDDSVRLDLPIRISEVFPEAYFATVAFAMHVDRADMASAHVYLRIPSVGAPFTLAVNGITVAAPAGGAECYVYDVKGYLKEGDSIVELRFRGDVGGITLTRPIEVLRTNYAVIRSISLVQRHDGRNVTLGIDLDTVGSTENVRAVATLVSGAGQLYYGGLSGGYGSIHVKDPLLWWPRGMGMQNMYKLTVNLYGDMEIEDTVECRVGLRSIGVADGGIIVNGARLVPMGAVYRPDMNAPVANSHKLAEAEIMAAAASGFNTLVIPADAARPDELLTGLCDVHGILLIKELAVADRESAQGYAAISTHPSVGVFDAPDEVGALLAEANAGFAHIKTESFPEYPSALSLPGDRMLFKVLPESERNLFSEAVESDREEDVHTALLATARRYPYAGSLSDFAYLSRLNQADGVALELMDRRMSGDADARSIFDGIGCTSELLSTSCLDGLGGRRALSFVAGRIFSPLAVQAEYKDGVISFKMVNGSRKVFDGALEYRIADNRNSTVITDRLPAFADVGGVCALGSVDVSAQVREREREVYLEYVLYDGTTPVYRDTLLFVVPKRFDFCDPTVRTSVSGSDKRFTLTLTATAFAKGVEISLGDIPVYLSDNYIDITSPAPVKVTMTTGTLETVERVRSMLKIRSIYDIK